MAPTALPCPLAEQFIASALAALHPEKPEHGEAFALLHFCTITLLYHCTIALLHYLYDRVVALVRDCLPLGTCP